MLTRREMLRLGLLGGAGGLLPLGKLVSIAGAHGTDGGASFGGVSRGSPPVALFQKPLPVPPVLQPTVTDASTDFYMITMRPNQVEILPGLLTTIWGYDGQFPGPTIRARQGRRVVVRQVNQVGFDTAVHLHGGKVAPQHDGHPIDVIPPGGYRDYYYPNRQPGLTMWYHDHADHRAGPNIYRGLAAFYLLEGEDEAGLGLPDGEFDVPLMIQDRLFNADGSLSYPFDVHGVNGDTILVNGAAYPRFEVARRRYRLRLLNGSNHREYLLGFDAALPVSQIATDGGLMPSPVPRQSIRLAPAERVEVVVDFAAAPLGARIVLRNGFGSGRTAQVMRFDVTRDASDGSRLPGSLRPLENLGPPAVSRNFDLTFDQRRQVWLINNQGFDPGRIDAFPRLDSTEIWQFNNRSQFMHPMHLHLVQFQVLDRRGVAPPAYEVGMKDTVAVQPFEKVRVLARFSRYTGPYVFHCHRLEHEDRDMMGQFRVVG